MGTHHGNIGNTRPSTHVGLPSSLQNTYVHYNPHQPNAWAERDPPTTTREDEAGAPWPRVPSCGPWAWRWRAWCRRAWPWSTRRCNWEATPTSTPRTGAATQTTSTGPDRPALPGSTWSSPLWAIAPTLSNRTRPVMFLHGVWSCVARPHAMSWMEWRRTGWTLA